MSARTRPRPEPVGQGSITRAINQNYPNPISLRLKFTVRWSPKPRPVPALVSRLSPVKAVKAPKSLN